MRKPLSLKEKTESVRRDLTEMMGKEELGNDQAISCLNMEQALFTEEKRHTRGLMGKISDAQACGPYLTHFFAALLHIRFRTIEYVFSHLRIVAINSTAQLLPSIQSRYAATRYTASSSRETREYMGIRIVMCVSETETGWS
jgi:hypothetical protein